jgi:uncharacterized protein (TIGR03067 family)
MLDGIWIPQGAEFAGEAIPFPRTRLVITGDRYIVEGEAGRDEGHWTANTDLTPHTIDLVGTAGPHRGQTIAGLFRLRGNLLQLCYAVGPGDAPPPRPTVLGAPAGTLQMVVRYRRET